MFFLKLRSQMLLQKFSQKLSWTQGGLFCVLWMALGACENPPPPFEEPPPPRLQASPRPPRAPRPAGGGRGADSRPDLSESPASPPLESGVHLSRLVAELGLSNLGNTCFFNAFLSAVSLPALLPFLTGEKEGFSLPSNAFGKAWSAFLKAHVGSYLRVTDFYQRQPALLNAQVADSSGALSPGLDLAESLYPRGMKSSLLSDLVKAMIQEQPSNQLAQELAVRQQQDASEAFSELTTHYGAPLVPLFEEWSFQKLLKPGVIPGMEPVRTRRELGSFPLSFGIQKEDQEQPSCATLQACLEFHFRTEEVRDPKEYVFADLNDQHSEKVPFDKRLVLAEHSSAKGSLAPPMEKKSRWSALFSPSPKKGRLFPFLMVALKRFSLNKTTRQMSKLQYPVDFLGPLQLPFIVDSKDDIDNDLPWKRLLLGTAFKNLPRLPRIYLKSFNLRSIVIHFGGYGGGHYTALVHHPDPKDSQNLLKGFWTYRDDSNPSLIPAVDFKASEPYKEALTNGYFFVYEALP